MKTIKDIDSEIKKVAYKGEFNIKERLSPEFDDLIKTLQFPDKFYDTLDRVIKREVQESREKINKIIEEWYLEHRKKGDGIGDKLYKKYGIQLIIPNKRINFETPSGKGSGSWFATAWFCFGLNLPKDLMFIELNINGGKTNGKT